MSKSYDVIVIGAGPAGYVAAIRCAQLGLNTVCIDNWLNEDGKSSLGGTCLNVGCIPSKALLESSRHYDQLLNQYKNHGIHATNISIDISTMQERKQNIVKGLTGGISALFKANKIKQISGHGRLLANRHVEITPLGKGKKTTISAEYIILAPGSRPVKISAAEQDDEKIVDSSGALAFQTVPKRLGIIGAGAIGLEVGSIWRRLGAEVIILEAQDNFLSIADEQISRMALKQYKTQGLDIRLGACVTATKTHAQTVTMTYRDTKGESTLKVDKLVVAVGRRPNSENIYASESDLLVNEGGFIHVNERCETNLPGVYAIGDAVRGPMLAHKGSEEGMAVAETIAGHHGSVNYDIIPAVIYTEPEIAWVGRTEQALRSSEEKIKIGTFPFAANGRARAMDEASGLIKIITDANTDRILGVHILGPNASELIAEATLAMEFSASAEDLIHTIHAHPTLSEAMHEAALASDNRAIHQINKTK